MFHWFRKPSKLSVSAIEHGNHLDRAVNTSVSHFFGNRMQNKVRKAPIGAWYILYEDNDWVYWGFPTFYRLFSNKRIVEVGNFFRTPRQALREQFPKYKEIDGLKLKPKIWNHCVHAVKQENPTLNCYLNNWKASLQDKTISIVTSLQTHIQGKIQQKLHFHLVMDKNTLELIHIELIETESV